MVSIACSLPPRSPRRWRGARRWLVCAAWLATSAHAQIALTLDHALRLAQERSRELVGQDAAASAARELAVAAGRLPDPQLKLGINNLPVDGADAFSLTADFMTMRSVGLMQEFTSEDKRQARAARFDSAALSAEASRALALAALRRETALAWLDRHYLARLAEVLQAQRAETALQIEAAEAAYRGGRGAQADVFAARSMVAQIGDRLRQNELQVAVARARLARWIGPEAEQPLAALPPGLDRLGFDAARDGAAWDAHPRIALLARQEAVARAEAEVARSNKAADWSAEFMYSQRGPAYSNMVSINFSIPLQLDQANRQDRELAAKLALAEQARAQQEEAVRDVAAETRVWAEQWRIDRERLAHYDATLLPLAAERTQAAIAAYRGGRGPLAAVLEARRMEIETRLDRLRIEMEAAGLWARLEFLLPPQRITASKEP